MIENLANIYKEMFRLAYAGYSYQEIRKMFSEYSSQLVANAIYDVRALRKSVLKLHSYPKKLNPTILLRKKDYRIEGNKVSIIYKPRNRLVLSVFPSEKQLEKMKQGKVKGARIVENDGKYFLNVVVEKEVELPPLNECKSIVGVDIGINYLAVCSALVDGKFTNPIFFKGGEWKHLCDRKRKIKNTASEEFKKITRRQHEILHTVAKRIVEYAKKFEKPVIVLEKFGKFKNNNHNKRFNFLLTNWARRKLQFMIEYKAKWEGIPVVYVNPYKTSQICHYCGAEGKREGKIFKCLKCGRQYDADANASMNLAKKFRQLLDEGTMIGERSPEGVSLSGEGDTCLPIQTHIQPGNGSQMKRMKVQQTLRLPLGVGGG
jgi:IS605 OrfB family transposase